MAEAMIKLNGVGGPATLQPTPNTSKDKEKPLKKSKKHIIQKITPTKKFNIPSTN